MGMTILETQIYRGANYWAPMQAIRFLLDIGELEERPTNLIPGFYEKLTTTLPTMYEHRCSVGHAGGFFERVLEGTWMGHVLEHTTLELQTLAGQEIGYGKARSARDPEGQIRYGIYHVVFEYEQEDVGLAAGKLAQRLLEWFIWPERDPEFVYQHELEGLIRLAERRAFGPSTRALVEEARRREIPVLRLDDRRSLVQLGHGMYQERIWATVTSKGSDIAVDIASNKELTNRLLPQRRHPRPARLQRGRRRRGGLGSRADRLPGTSEAARRQPRARRRDQPAGRGGGARPLPDRARRNPLRHRRRGVVYPRQGLPRARRRRPGRRRRRTGPGARRRRRRHDVAELVAAPTPTRAAASATSGR